MATQHKEDGQMETRKMEYTPEQINAANAAECRRMVVAQRNADIRNGIPVVFKAADINASGEAIHREYLLTGVWRLGKAPEAPPAPKADRPAPGSMEALILDIVERYFHAEGLDEARINGMIREALEKALLPKVVRVEPKGRPEGGKDMGPQHMAFAEALKIVHCVNYNGHRLNLWLTGPSGSGKTHMAEQMAKAIVRRADIEGYGEAGGLGVPFYAMSVGPQTTESKLVGYMDAKGEYAVAMAYLAMKHGGVYLIDEIDAGNPGVGTVLNAATSGSSYRFPNGELVIRHPDCIFIAAANTWGMGADKDFVGRVKQDEATLARFVFMAHDIDEALEVSMYGDGPITRKMHAIRRKVFSLREKVQCGSRQLGFVHSLVAGGFDVNRAFDLAIWNRVNDDVKARCNA